MNNLLNSMISVFAIIMLIAGISILIKFSVQSIVFVLKIVAKFAVCGIVLYLFLFAMSTVAADLPSPEPPPPPVITYRDYLTVWNRQVPVLTRDSKFSEEGYVTPTMPTFKYGDYETEINIGWCLSKPLADIPHNWQIKEIEAAFAMYKTYISITTQFLGLSGCSGPRTIEIQFTQEHVADRYIGLMLWKDPWNIDTAGAAIYINDKSLFRQMEAIETPDGSGKLLRKVMIHEIGHALGLGHSDNPYAIQNLTGFSSQSYFSGDMVTAIQNMWPKKQAERSGGVRSLQ